jgi:hypothetical protein
MLSGPQMGNYNRLKFQQIMLPRDLVGELKNLKQAATDSLASVVRRLLDSIAIYIGRQNEMGWIKVSETPKENRDLWESELFG